MKTYQLVLDAGNFVFVLTASCDSKAGAAKKMVFEITQKIAAETDLAKKRVLEHWHVQICHQKLYPTELRLNNHRSELIEVSRFVAESK